MKMGSYLLDSIGSYSSSHHRDKLAQDDTKIIHTQDIESGLSFKSQIQIICKTSRLIRAVNV